ncbi:hypothetical protein [Oceanobacillus halotolerans]|uniref:hypothetical protein n=1 Tax=Oceanobacillus halotolerans TaxID=2663380 RepID=UPI0013D93DFC|nr:hypothetical protein [Oceanobacillus halotolerans]
MLKKLGWFGWTFTTVILITIIGASIFFFNLFDLDMKSLVNGEEESAEADSQQEEVAASEETIEEVETIQETVGQDHQEIGDFVSDMHDFYNDTTGYGGINNLNWDEQAEQAEYVDGMISDFLSEVNNEALLNDLQHIQELAQNALESQDADYVRNLHRLFHDLDIALNSYDGYDKIWGVTETLKSAN